jgi:hypothetical protein
MFSEDVEISRYVSAELTACIFRIKLYASTLNMKAEYYAETPPTTYEPHL